VIFYAATSNFPQSDTISALFMNSLKLDFLLSDLHLLLSLLLFSSLRIIDYSGLVPVFEQLIIWLNEKASWLILIPSHQWIDINLEILDGALEELCEYFLIFLWNWNPFLIVFILNLAIVTFQVLHLFLLLCFA